jgi:acylphosphatase
MNIMKMLRQAKITVGGEVQGVFYRYWAKGQAEELGLTGSARNEPDGTVLIVVEGEEENIKELVDRCWIGSELAKVSNVEVEWSGFTGTFPSFSIL